MIICRLRKACAVGSLTLPAGSMVRASDNLRSFNFNGVDVRVGRSMLDPVADTVRREEERTTARQEEYHEA